MARMRVVDEATAAAVGYCARLNPGGVFLVFDFGVGTLDTSVVRVMDPTDATAGAAVRTIAKAGLDLGGDHIDALVADHVAEIVGVPLGDTDAYNRIFRGLLRSAEAAKVALTHADSTVIEAYEYRLEITRSEFERLLIAGGYELSDHIQHDYAIRHVNRDTGAYEFETIVTAGTEYPTPEPIRTLTIKAIRDGQKNLGIAIYEIAHASFREASSDLEIVFDAHGGARTIAVTAQQLRERSRLWLNEESPTFLEADPPAKAGLDRFQLQFRLDAQKRLTVSALDLERRTLVLDQFPVVRLA
jgi:hypothetical protein